MSLYGQIADNPKINDFIYRCFDDLPETEQRKFVKEFKKQPHDEDQVKHTLAELVCGAYLGSRQYRVKHDYRLTGKKPDWCIFDEVDSIQGIIEVFNFHIDKATDNYIKKQKARKPVVAYCRDGNVNNKARLYECIKQKTEVYRDLVVTLSLSYVIALFPDILACVDLEEVKECLFSEKVGLFDLNLQVSGVLYFEENVGRYLFQYIANPKCSRPITLPEGFYP